MSIQAVAWALDQNVPDPYQKLILISLANHADHTGRCFPGLACIAREASCSRETVMRRLPLLEVAGLISIERNVQGAQKLRNIYRLSLPGSVQQTLPPSVPQTLPTTPARPDRCLPDTRGSVSADTRGGVSVDTTKEPSLNHHSTVSGSRPPPALKRCRPSEIGPEVLQNEIAGRLGFGDAATGWTLFGALSASEQDQLTAQHRSRRLTDEALAAARTKALGCISSPRERLRGSGGSLASCDGGEGERQISRGVAQ